MLLISGVIFLFVLFYNSFVDGEDIYLFNHQIAPFWLIALIYIFSFAIFYLLSKKINLVFIFIQLPILLSLLFIGEYTYALVFEFVFLFVFFDTNKTLLKEVFLSIYLLAVFNSLALLFASNVFLYFVNLFLFIYLLFSQRDILENFKRKNLFLYLVVLIAVVFSIVSLDDVIFDLYIWLDVVDAQNFHNEVVLLILSVVHIIILALLVSLKSSDR